RRGVIIQDPEKTTTIVTVKPKVQAKDKGKAILIEEPKPLKMELQIDLDEEVIRHLEAELNADINWNVVIEQVKRSERLTDAIVLDDDDDVYADATPLASEIPIVDYKIYTKRNIPYFKIIRAGGNHRERFKKTKPKNYSDDYLLNTLKIMFEKPNVEANVWKDQKGKYGLSKMYPLAHFTLEQMVNNVSLEVDDESELSLELLRLVRRQLNEGYVPQ
nr:hypothetical protein [Tanacetum cinerariifolium]